MSPGSDPPRAGTGAGGAAAPGPGDGADGGAATAGRSGTSGGADPVPPADASTAGTGAGGDGPAPPLNPDEVWWDYIPRFHPAGNEHGRAIPFAAEMRVPEPPVTTRRVEVSSAVDFNREAQQDGTHLHVVADITDGNCYANASDLRITFEPGVAIRGQLAFGSFDYTVHRIEVDGGDRPVEERGMVDADREYPHSVIAGNGNLVHTDIVLRRMRLHNTGGIGLNSAWSRAAVVDCVIKVGGPSWELQPSTEAQGYPLSDLYLLGNTVLSHSGVIGIDVGLPDNPESVTRFVAWGNHIESAASHPAVVLRSPTSAALLENVLRVSTIELGGTGSAAPGDLYIYDNHIYTAEAPRRVGEGPARLEWLGNTHYGHSLGEFLSSMSSPGPGQLWTNAEGEEAWGESGDANAWLAEASPPAWPSPPGDPNAL